MMQSSGSSTQYGTVQAFGNESGCSFVVHTQSDGSISISTPYVGMPVYYGDFLSTGGQNDTMRVNALDGGYTALGATTSMSVNYHDPQSAQSWLETLFGRFTSWVTSLTQGSSTPQNGTSANGVIGLNGGGADVPLSDGSIVNLASQGDWMGWDSVNYIEYDAAVGSYYDYSGGSYDPNCPKPPTCSSET